MQPEKRRWGWTGPQRNEPQKALLTRVRVSVPSGPVGITAEQSSQKRSENGQALQRLKGDFSSVTGRKKAESKKMLFTEWIYRQSHRGQHEAWGR